jgi:hypothetical protein
MTLVERYVRFASILEFGGDPALGDRTRYPYEINASGMRCDIVMD